MPSRDKSGETRLFARARSLSDGEWETATGNWWRNSGLLAHTLMSVGREPKNSRMAGCAGSPKPTRLSLQTWEMQDDFAKLQG
jgi:hypothetical protein